jgi:SOS-response transcriptional repressor LexA
VVSRLPWFEELLMFDLVRQVERLTLTEGEAKVLGIVHNFVRAYGRAPTIDDIKARLGTHSREAGVNHLVKLRSKGYLTWEIPGAELPAVPSDGCPLELAEVSDSPPRGPLKERGSANDPGVRDRLTLWPAHGVPFLGEVG